jgi:hypothetical protein
MKKKPSIGHAAFQLRIAKRADSEEKSKNDETMSYFHSDFLGWIRQLRIGRKQKIAFTDAQLP